MAVFTGIRSLLGLRAASAAIIIMDTFSVSQTNEDSSIPNYKDRQKGVATVALQLCGGFINTAFFLGTLRARLSSLVSFLLQSMHHHNDENHYVLRLSLRSSSSATSSSSSSPSPSSSSSPASSNYIHNHYQPNNRHKLRVRNDSSCGT